MKSVNVYSYDKEYNKYYILSKHYTRLAAKIAGNKERKRGHYVIIAKHIDVFYDDQIIDLTNTSR